MVEELKYCVCTCLLQNYFDHTIIVAFFYRYGLNIRHRLVEDKLMRQKAQLLLDEAATWSLLWFLYGKGNISQTLDVLFFMD